jgi:hypothetical protein
MSRDRELGLGDDYEGFGYFEVPKQRSVPRQSSRSPSVSTSAIQDARVVCVIRSVAAITVFRDNHLAYPSHQRHARLTEARRREEDRLVGATQTSHGAEDPERRPVDDKARSPV